MAIYKLVGVSLALGLCLVAGSGAQQSEQREEFVQKLVEALPPDTITGVEVFDTSGFRVESSQVKHLRANFEPTDDLVQVLSVTAEGVFQVGIEKGKPMSSEGGGLAIFHRETGAPMLSVGDRDGDGRLDVLTYSVLDERGELILDVIDYEADGQADARLNFKEGSFEIWYLDGWRRVEEREGRRYILMDTKEVWLETRDSRWIVP